MLLYNGWIIEAYREGLRGEWAASGRKGNDAFTVAKRAGNGAKARAVLAAEKEIDRREALAKKETR